MGGSVIILIQNTCHKKKSIVWSLSLVKAKGFLLWVCSVWSLWITIHLIGSVQFGAEVFNFTGNMGEWYFAINSKLLDVYMLQKKLG